MRLRSGTHHGSQTNVAQLRPDTDRLKHRHPVNETEFLRKLKAELGRVYHDLSNPLAIVSGNLELVNELRKAGVPPEEMLESIADAHAGAEGFTKPLEDLMRVRGVVEERLKSMPSDD